MWHHAWFGRAGRGQGKKEQMFDLSEAWRNVSSSETPGG